jgi:ABC-2 type transport system ATP-binding protein
MLHLARNLNRSWDAARAAARIADLGIAPGRSVGSLSGGQQAQLALTIALAKRPRMLILDEPLARLDPLARHEFMSVLMAAVAEDDLSVIFSSHAVAELERVADYLIALHSGRLQVDGEVDDLLARHQVLTGPVAEITEHAKRVAPVHVTRAGTLAHELVRTSGPAEPVPPCLEAHAVGLEELVLAYLREPGAAALPRLAAALAGGSAGARP